MSRARVSRNSLSRAVNARGNLGALLEAVAGAAEWLDNIADAMGEAQMIDLLPNGYGGRVALRAAYEQARKGEADA